MAEDVWILAITAVGKGIDPGATQHVRCSRSPAEAADTIRDHCWQRPDLTWGRGSRCLAGAGGGPGPLRRGTGGKDHGPARV